MSLLRLLTAGKSLIGVKSTVARYTFSDPRSMPKFRSTVNPFKAKTEKIGAAEPATKVAEARSEAAEADKGKTEKCGGAEPVATKLEETVAVAGNGIADKALEEAGARELIFRREGSRDAELGADASPRVSSWISKLSSLTSKWRLPGKGNPTERRPVQGELSLENIKVVRNDLSESDLEVVAAGSTKASQKQPKRSAATAVPAVESLAEKATATAGEHG